MWTFVTASLFLALAFMHSVNMTFSALPEDLEGSGHDLDSSGSGSGEWSEHGEVTDMKIHPNSKDQTTDNIQWPAVDIESEIVVMGNSKSFLENQQILTGIIAGGVTGVILAALLTALLVYMWQKKGDGGYILGQQTDREEIIFNCPHF